MFEYNLGMFAIVYVFFTDRLKALIFHDYCHKMNDVGCKAPKGASSALHAAFSNPFVLTILIYNYDEMIS